MLLKTALALTRNVVSQVGVALTSASAMVFVTLFVLELAGFHGGPYFGIFAFLVLPGVFVLGLLLIPLGVFVDRHRRRREGGRARLPVVDLNRARTRRMVFLVGGLTAVNAVLLSVATYKALEFSDSTEFCGTTCHSVMEPEYTAYQNSPHARVGCTDCHIGPGAGWFARSKLSGSWQVVAVTLDLYPRPIPSPVHNLRPAKETCAQCHWPEKFVGDKLKVKTSFQEDEENTELKTVLLLKVGGVEGRRSSGIHWHVDPGNEIRYRSDSSRETIYDVELVRRDGTTVTFANGQPEEEAEELEWRTMDCVDCHNRPTHIYLTPEQAVDKALLAGRASRELPFVRQQAVDLVQVEYASLEEAQAGIESGLFDYYRSEYPEVATASEDDIRAAAAAFAEGWSQNVFPKMNVGWKTYPDHIGHERFPGCFRCHDDEHESAEGEVISQDCDTCHSLLAWEEEEPDILAELNP